MSKSQINLAVLNVNPEIVSSIRKNENGAAVGGARVVYNLPVKVPAKDFDTPTINDNCFSAGTTTFTSSCGWCGFWHETGGKS